MEILTQTWSDGAQCRPRNDRGEGWVFLSAPGSVDRAPRKLEPAPQEVTAVFSDRMHAWLQGRARTLGSKANKQFNE